MNENETKKTYDVFEFFCIVLSLQVICTLNFTLKEKSWKTKLEY